MIAHGLNSFVVYFCSLRGLKGPCPPPMGHAPPHHRPRHALATQPLRCIYPSCLFSTVIAKGLFWIQCIPTYASDNPHRWKWMQQHMLSGCCLATSVLNEAQGQRQSGSQDVLLLQWLVCRCMQTKAHVVIPVLMHCIASFVARLSASLCRFCYSGFSIMPLTQVFYTWHWFQHVPVIHQERFQHVALCGFINILFNCFHYYAFLSWWMFSKLLKWDCLHIK